MNYSLRTLSLLITITGTFFCGQVWGMASGEQKKQWESDLIQAVTENNFNKVNTLLSLPADQKGDINAYDDNGWTALYNAIERGASLKIIRQLIMAGAKPNIPTSEVIFRYPIHAAIEKGRVGTLYLLVNHRADINAQDGIGNTPLSLAVKINNASCIKFLRDRGAQ
ncbi:MAG: ankyrin repeat domain-containing protein [Candidatus Babeliales bacterium]